MVSLRRYIAIEFNSIRKEIFNAINLGCKFTEDRDSFIEQELTDADITQIEDEQTVTEIEITQIEDEQMLTDHDIAIMELQAAAE